jgi:hypothetical protein
MQSVYDFGTEKMTGHDKSPAMNCNVEPENAGN